MASIVTLAQLERVTKAGRHRLSRMFRRVSGAKATRVEPAFGDSVVNSEANFPDLGIVSPRRSGERDRLPTQQRDDADGLRSRGINAVSQARHELADSFWGERPGQLTDVFGHHWNIAQRPRDVPHDEIVAAAAGAFGSS